MQIAVIGSGYVGLASGACFADFGCDVMRALDLRQLVAAPAEPGIIDLRNIYRPEEMSNAGFNYFGGGSTAGGGRLAWGEVCSFGMRCSQASWTRVFFLS